MKKLIILIPLFVIALSSCKKDIPPDTSTIDELARDYLYDAMNDIYFWYQLMPVVTKEDFTNPYELMDAMIYKEVDRWSGLQTYDEYVAQSQGSFVGHGIRMGLDPENKVRIVQIYKNSPLYSNGVRRGWIIKKVNNQDAAPIFIAGDAAGFDQLFGPSEANVTNTFLFQIPDGRDSTITSTKTSFILNTVLVSDTLHLKSGITGHLVFDQFIPPSNQELETAFAFFKESEITDLIVDLRYNAGGDITVLTNLASYIAGITRVNSNFLRLTFNDKNSGYDVAYNFKSVASPLSLSKIITICTRYTTSASEDLINGLRPYLDVVCIGDTTNGKPVGMVGIPYKTYYMFWPISFSLVNSDNEGEFYDGLPPLKYVPDDVTRDWKDREEYCLKEAIYYLENGSASPKGTYNYQPSVYFSEKPERINNAYILDKH